MIKRILLLGILSVFCLAGEALAQDSGKMKEISFDADDISGDLMMPTGQTIGAKGMSDLSSLIKAREDFVDEMLKSVDDL